MSCYTLRIHTSGSGWVWTVYRCGLIANCGRCDTREEAAREGDAELRWYRQSEESRRLVSARWEAIIGE